MAGDRKGRLVRPFDGSSRTSGYTKASSAPPMPSAFICWSSRRISGFSTAAPNHHQRIMGLASSGGFLKLDFRVSVEDCADKGAVAEPRRRAARMAACGNLEEMGRMVWITPVG